MDIRLIKNDKELKKALEVLRDLMEKNPAPDENTADEMMLLSIVIENYEKEHYPIPSPTPVEAIKFRMEQMGLSVKDLEPCIGKSNRVYEVLAGRRKLSLSMIRRLSKDLKISANILIGAV